MSDEAWNRIRGAMNAIIGVIQEASEEMKEDSNAVDLSSAIFNKMTQSTDHIGDVLSFVKKRD